MGMKKVIQKCIVCEMHCLGEMHCLWKCIVWGSAESEFPAGSLLGSDGNVLSAGRCIVCERIWKCIICHFKSSFRTKRGGNYTVGVYCYVRLEEGVLDNKDIY